MPPGPGDMPVTLGTDLVEIGGFGTRFLAGAEHTGGAYALVEHTPKELFPHARGLFMALQHARGWLLGLFVLACEAPAGREAAAPLPPTPPTEAAIGQAALAALAAAPWDSDPSGWGALCTPAAPCDTLVVDPRIVALPAQAPAFFVPDRRDLAATLSAYTLTLASVPGRLTVLGPWRDCSAQRDTPRWVKARVACVALAIAGPETARSDAMNFALLVATPAKGLSWPRVRVTRPRESWRGRLISNAGE